VIQSTASGVFICPPPRKTAESRKFQKNGGVQPPGSTPSHSRQRDPETDPSPCTKKGGSYLALLSFGFCHGLYQQLPHDGGPAHHLAFGQLSDDFINLCGDFGLNDFCHVYGVIYSPLKSSIQILYRNKTKKFILFQICFMLAPCQKEKNRQTAQEKTELWRALPLTWKPAQRLTGWPPQAD
jgi:hypothetical protein